MRYTTIAKMILCSAEMGVTHHVNDGRDETKDGCNSRGTKMTFKTTLNRRETTARGLFGLFSHSYEKMSS